MKTNLVFRRTCNEHGTLQAGYLDDTGFSYFDMNPPPRSKRGIHSLQTGERTGQLCWLRPGNRNQFQAKYEIHHVNMMWFDIIIIHACLLSMKIFTPNFQR